MLTSEFWERSFFRLLNHTADLLQYYCKISNAPNLVGKKIKNGVLLVLNAYKIMPNIHYNGKDDMQA